MKKIKLIPILFLLLFSLCSFSSCELIYDQKSEGRLILIGVGLDYMEDDGTSVNDKGLPNPTNDIREVAFALSSLSENTNKEFFFIPMLQQQTITTPDNNYPNKEKVNLLFDELINKTTISANVYKGNFDSDFSLISKFSSFGTLITMDPLNRNDTVIFYFCGHGETGNGDLRLPKDTNEQDRESYSLDILYSNISNLDSKSLVILDSCFSGTLIKESSTSINKAETPFVDRLPALYQKFFNYTDNNGIYEKFSIIASTKSDELSWFIEPPDSLHINSIFTYYFLEALGYISGIGIGEMSDSVLAKRNNKIDIDSIYNYVNKNITKQQPIIMGGRKSLVLFTFN